MEILESWEMVQSALDELAEAFSTVRQLSDREQKQFKAETMLLMVRQDELINELALMEQSQCVTQTN
jgi:hypothetical protein